MVMFKKLLHNPQSVITAIIILTIIVLGILAPVIAPHDPTDTNVAMKYASPSWEYPLGTDYLGRCTLSRLLHGIFPSVILVMLTVFCVIGIGTFIGIISAYYGGILNEILMRICDIMLSFPTEVMILAFVGIMGLGLPPMLIAIILLKWPWYAVVIRNAALKYKEKNYIYFSKASGMKGPAVILRHVLPMTLPDIILLASSNVSSTILLLSGFSFLGLGIQPPNPEWGNMLSEARDVILSHPTQMLPPGIAIMVVCLSFSLFGDAVRDAMDAKHVSKGIFKSKGGYALGCVTGSVGFGRFGKKGRSLSDK